MESFYYFSGFFLLVILYIIFDVTRERKQKNKQEKNN